MTPDEILREMAATTKRRFLPGLLLAFIDFLRELKATNGRFRSLDEFYRTYPRQTETRGGGGANTLIVEREVTDKHGKKKRSPYSIRPGYEQAQAWIFKQKRFDYPKAAPHATQAWDRYTHWLEALLSYSDAALNKLEEATKQFILDKFPAHEVDTAAIKREPPRFFRFIQDFKMDAQKGEKTGAAYQGTVFGYVRADAPHLQVDVDKVRAGGKRVGRVGDVDAREGEALVITAEVKQYALRAEDVDEFGEFATNVALNKALGLVVALDFEPGVREQLKKMGLEPVSREELASLVRMWDPLKQRIAVQALIYFVQYKEQSTPLLARVKAFFEQLDSAMESAPKRRTKRAKEAAARPPRSVKGKH